MITTEQLGMRTEQLPKDARRIAEIALEMSAAGILICDRNARPLGYALEQVVGQSGIVVPPIWYARVSKRVDRNRVAQWVGNEIESAPPVNRNEVLVVDDHISNGGTKLLARRCLETVAPSLAGVRLVTLTGKGSDTTLHPSVGSAIAAPWRDRADVIGFEYNDDGSVIAAPTDLSRRFYEEIDTAAKSG